MVRTILRYISLQGHVEDYETIHASIVKGIEFKGTNLWILVFAISMICVGLNINSPAVIIGAMLISPMMGPIVGMGYCIATYDFVLFKKALKNFSFAVGAGLTTSTLYFIVSPVSTVSSELLALTHPTIYDVMVALLGGLAAIVAISSKHKGNVIAGAAIATALMPPLCTAGFGLATGHFGYLFGAMYLFVINTVFIGISATLISQFLKFPIRSSVDETRKKRINRWIWIVIIITIIPSIYLGYQLVQEEKFKENANRFVSAVDIVNGNYLLNKTISPNQKTIRLVYGGNSLSPEDEKAIMDKSKEYALDKATVFIEQGFAFEGVNEIISETDKLKAEISRLKSILSINQNQLDSLMLEPQFGKRLLSEIQPLYPSIVACSYAKTVAFEKEQQQAMVIVNFTHKGKLSTSEQKKIKSWLSNRIQIDSIQVSFLEK